MYNNLCKSGRRGCKQSFLVNIWRGCALCAVWLSAAVHCWNTALARLQPLPVHPSVMRSRKHNLCRLMPTRNSCPMTDYYACCTSLPRVFPVDVRGLRLWAVQIFPHLMPFRIRTVSCHLYKSTLDSLKLDITANNIVCSTWNFLLTCYSRN